jgi:hypothetical protein
MAAPCAVGCPLTRQKRNYRANAGWSRTDPSMSVMKPLVMQIARE